MPRFFFHIRNGNGFTQDEEGLELDDLATVRKVALEGARSLLSDETSHGKLDLEGSIEVVDEAGSQVMNVRFDEALEMKPSTPRPAPAPSAPNRVGGALALHLSLIGDMSDADRAAVAALPGEVREVKRYKDIIRPGDQPKEAVIVLSGLLARYMIGPEGARQIHSFYIPTDSPCLETLHLDYMDNALGAVVDSEIGTIPHEALYAIMDERPDVLKLIWRETLVQGAIFREWLMRNSTMPAHASVAHFFCEIFTRAQAAGLTDRNSCELPITQELLSDAVGMTSVHVNRTLRLLREGGAMEWRDGRLIVPDFARLAEIADFNPTYLHLRRRAGG